MTGLAAAPGAAGTTQTPEGPPTEKKGGAPPRDSASQWRLVWRRFRRHRLAMLGLAVTAALYLVAIFADFLAPFGTEHFDEDYPYAPPQTIQFDGGLHVDGYTTAVDNETYEQTFTTDPSQRIPVGFFVRGEEYRLLGLIPWDRHLFGPTEPGAPMYLLGADRTGHDLLSQLIHGTRVSMTIGLIGVVVAFVLGVVLGGLSGYLAGRADTVIQRVVEFFMSLPSLPLWLGLAAALPPEWGPLQRYFAISVVLALIGWTHLAREVRGRFLALREEQFVTAARLDGCGRRRVILGHMLPSVSSHLIAQLSLSVPAMILAETALSFLGLGLQAPVVSWGVLLQDAQNVRVLETAPWLMIPGLAVVVAVLALNFAGDGLRDAADPYRR
ncbi:ABC transporter permease [Streptomyces radicis]|uniref:ABC transporter permease n=1 Tax=Streptomyces radicis TaxID=1750517 RepID=A0A3A9W517_9ACTN|nr:ABC transporter permease [Streptomyces radicis]RKN08335.1 ABC transporter permease [Streptomyces radicis]RKN21629.1 ABC transporter permease [Streptomyces radicis]